MQFYTRVGRESLVSTAVCLISLPARQRGNHMGVLDSFKCFTCQLQSISSCYFIDQLVKKFIILLIIQFSISLVSE